jgi:uncharacterized protein
MVTNARMLLWVVEATSGFDTAWASLDGGRLRADGRACGLPPTPYWVDYALETDEEYGTRHMSVQSQWDGGSAALELGREDGGWTVNGESRDDLAEALDCDLAACPLTNTMPILRHGLHRGPGDHELLMAFIEVPSLKVDTSRQRYTHLRMTDDGGAIVRYRSGSFQSDLTIDGDGFVVEYPRLGRRIETPRGAR